MTAITIEIDDSKLSRYADSFLALAWHVAQANPAPFGDHRAGELVEHIGREIIRRWLGKVPPELWHHQGSHSPHKWLSQFARYTPGEGHQSLPAFSAEHREAFHAGHWSIKPEAAAALLPAGGEVVAAAIEWQEAKRPGGDFMRGVRAEKALAEALEVLLKTSTDSDAPAEEVSP
ncbi:hypothetical protein [Phytohabitans rumicis]|uniref:Uncharacterized protein n=1 Tax=Phytohabitans rumicis TaxID=1076125 RepID=A0A6V8L842_9ACTN|nr:hypothetical protein [Phytohabitans rumicis]GFJ92454.1 hypothetical protein Prum_060960 [Phytohabitans rumicis]